MGRGGGARKSSRWRRLASVRGIAGALSLRALVHIYQGELDAATARLAEAHEVFGGRRRLDRNIFSQVVTAEMMLALERGDAATALAAAQGLEQLPASSGLQCLALSLVGEAQVMAGEPERALATARDVVAHGPPGNNFTAACGSRVEGLARQTLEQPSMALACLERASQAFAAAGMPFDAARARLEWATLAAATEPNAATAAAQDSLAVFERLGAQRYAKRTRGSLYQTRRASAWCPPTTLRSDAIEPTRARGRAASCGGSDQCPDRRPLGHQPAHRDDPPGPHLRPTRDQLPHRPGALRHRIGIAPTR
jgi:hypothetical protein